MKFNWGHGIAIFLIIFVSITIGVVIKISTDDTYNHELEYDNYYDVELKYQAEIDKINNAKELSSTVKYRISDKGITLTFPEDFRGEKVTGSIEMLRPSKKILDFNMPVVLDDNLEMLIPTDKAIEGMWKIKVSWNSNGKDYLFKSSIRR